jgi:hypothetical protein
MDYVLDVLDRHGGKGKVVARGEADYTAAPGFALRNQQTPVFDVQAVGGAIGLKRGKIVVEDERTCIDRIADTANPRISGTEIAGRVILGLAINWDLFELPLPGAACTMGGHQHPLVSKGVQSAMWIFGKLQ